MTFLRGLGFYPSDMVEMFELLQRSSAFMRYFRSQRDIFQEDVKEVVLLRWRSDLIKIMEIINR